MGTTISTIRRRVHTSAQTSKELDLSAMLHHSLSSVGESNAIRSESVAIPREVTVAISHVWEAINNCESSITLRQARELDDSLPIVESLLSNIDLVDDIRSTLSTFANDLNRKINSLDQRYTILKDNIAQASLRHPINALPEEILAEILFQATDGFKSIVALSSVCRRFLSAALSAPRIWASLELNLVMDAERIKTILKRSGVLPLKAFIIDEDLTLGLNKNTNPLQVVKEIALSSSRFKEVVFDMNHDYTNQFNEYLQLSGGFPALQTLYLLSEFPFDMGEMPRLRELILTFAPQSLMGTNLIKCTLNPDKLHLGRMVDFLSSCNRLQELYLLLECRIFEVVDEGAIDSLRPVTLPSLVSLAITFFHEDDIHPHLLNHLLALIRPSAISKLELDLTYGYNTARDPEAMELLRGKFLRFIQNNPSITDLRIRLARNTSVEYDAVDVDLDDIFKLVPKGLESISLTFPYQYIADRCPFGHRTLKSLRRLRFEKCSWRTKAAFICTFENIYRVIREDFDGLEFKGCKGLKDYSSPSLEPFVPGASDVHTQCLKETGEMIGASRQNTL